MGRTLALAAVFLAACASTPPQAPSRAALAPIAWPGDSAATELAVLNRVSWGANRSSQAEIAQLGSGRWLDAQERVDNVPLPAELREWLQAYTDANYQPEPKKRKRPASFLPPDKRQ